MTNPPTLPPKVEKEFREEFKNFLEAHKFADYQIRLESFFAKVIAEEVEKAKREQIEKDAELAFKSIESVNPVVYAAKVKRDILAQLTPDQLSE